MEVSEQLGKANFEAYNQSVGGVTYDGKKIPPWENLSEKVKAGWIAGALRVVTLQRQIDNP